MSFRARVAGAVALAAGLTAVAPAAIAATPTTLPQPPVQVSLSAPTPQGPLLVNGHAETFTMTATNTTSKPQAFAPELDAVAKGAIGLTRSDASMRVAPLNAPASSFTYLSRNGELVGDVVPQGRQAPAPFTIPAHQSFSWEVLVAAGPTWQVNDNALLLRVVDMAQPEAVAQKFVKSLTFKVGTAVTGGPVPMSIHGPATIVLGRTEGFDVTITNRTGARLNFPLGEALFISAETFAGGKSRYGFANFTVQILRNGHWVNGYFGVIPAGLANGATRTFHFRIRLNSYQPTVKGGVTKLALQDEVFIGERGVGDYKQKLLTIVR